MLRVLMLLALLIPFGLSQADEGPDPSFPTPPRISLLDGQASFWRAGAEDWAPAVLNTPLASGDSLYTGPETTAEVQVGPQAYLRLRDGTEVQLSDIESDYLQIRLTGGEASLDVREMAPGQAIEVNTPNAAFTVERSGYYRLSVDEDSTRMVTRRGGTAEVTPAGQGATRIEPGEELVVSGTDEATLQGYAAPRPDEWDRWNTERSDYLRNSISARYVPAGVYGGEDLDRYGTWRRVDPYGPVWIPTSVPAGWAPYSAGHWIHDPLFGWTWVDNAPWGYAPFHYGRWVYVRGAWAWAPGPRVARPVYSPALVAWYHGGPASGGVSVGWVALGWGEPVSPWWGPSRFAGRPYWGGWGGPRVVTNVTHITYVNARYRNAVIATDSDRFGRGDHDFHRAAPDDVRHWRPSERGADVRPSAVSLVPAEGRAVRPPRPEMERRVVVARPPREPGERLHDAGQRPPERSGPPPRIASPAASPAPQPAVTNARERERGREQADQQRAAIGLHGNPAPAMPSPRADQPRAANGLHGNPAPATPSPRAEARPNTTPQSAATPQPAATGPRETGRGREQADQQRAANGSPGNPAPATPSPHANPRANAAPPRQEAKVTEPPARNRPAQNQKERTSSDPEKAKPAEKARQHAQKDKKEEQSRKD
ncbi:MAG TPA: DUF6600 domain-containing protein [Burkholderiales bacterium]|nr:DUF6600 domain-containing protein [Burkholderiales bacterium]